MERPLPPVPRALRQPQAPRLTVLWRAAPQPARRPLPRWQGAAASARKLGARAIAAWLEWRRRSSASRAHASRRWRLRLVLSRVLSCWTPQAPAWSPSAVSPAHGAAWALRRLLRSSRLFRSYSRARWRASASDCPVRRHVSREVSSRSPGYVRHTHHPTSIVGTGRASVGTRRSRHLAPGGLSPVAGRVRAARGATAPVATAPYPRLAQHKPGRAHPRTHSLLRPLQRPGSRTGHDPYTYGMCTLPRVRRQFSCVGIASARFNDSTAPATSGAADMRT